MKTGLDQRKTHGSGEGPRYISSEKDGQCFAEAFVNSRNLVPGEELKIVSGSLGFQVACGTGNKKKWFYEFGGDDTFVKEKKYAKKTGSIDAHFWLEDSKGLIYDRVRDGLYYAAVLRKAKIGCAKGAIIRGKSKEEMESLGLKYVPFPNDDQVYLYNRMKESAVRNLRNGIVTRAVETK